jgi:hypothetical protein
MLTIVNARPDGARFEKLALAFCFHNCLEVVMIWKRSVLAYATAVLASACAITSAGADDAIPLSNHYAAYYDGHYGDISDGYWGRRGKFFWYKDRANVWHQDDESHFRRDPAAGFTMVHGSGVPRLH